jgi:hypothetical protein
MHRKTQYSRPILYRARLRGYEIFQSFEFTYYIPHFYRGADKSLARPTSRCILFHGENISYDARLVLYIYIYMYE